MTLGMLDLVFPIKLFHCSKRQNPNKTVTYMMTAELSDLEGWLGNRLKLAEFTVHGDSADIDFSFVSYDLNGDEVAGWRYVPTAGQEKILNGKSVELLIIND